MRVDIRRLEPSQIDAVADLAVRAWEPNFASMADILGPALFRRSYGDDWRAYQERDVRSACEKYDTWVAHLDDDVAGFVAIDLRTDDSVGEVYMLAVDPRHQRRGVGMALTEFSIETIRAAGLTLVEIGTGGDPGHAAARGLYEKAGLTGFPSMHYSMLLERSSGRHG